MKGNQPVSDHGGHDTTGFIMKISGIEAVTGSLGQGLSVALGMALGVRLEGLPSRVYCVIGDGEAAVRNRDLDL